MPISSIQTNVADVRRELLQLAPKLRVRAIRNALANAARIVRDEARRRAPVLKLSTFGGQSAYRRGRRKPGTVRKAISVRTSKLARRRGDVGVFVNVRPAKAGQRGAKNPNDPFYWRFVEFGHKIIGRYKGKYTDYRLRGRGRLTGLAKRRKAPLGFVKPIPFLRTAAGKLDAALAVIMPELQAAIAKLNTPKAPPP